jgi:hypothetical protein
MSQTNWMSRHGRRWILVIPVLAVIAIAALAVRGAPPPAPPSAIEAATLPDVTEDDATGILKIEAPPVPAQRPSARSGRNAPRRSQAPSVDWASLSGGAAEVEVAIDAPAIRAADLETGMSAEQARTLIADARERERPRGGGGGIAVIGRGTPRGGGACD